MMIVQSSLQDILTSLEPGAKIKQYSSGRMVKQVGQKYNRLVLLAATTLRLQRNIVWLCKCDCGSYVLASAHVVISGKTKSCGCYQDECHKAMRLPLGVSAFNSVLYDYKHKAHARGINWGLTDKQFRRLTKMDCWYCGATPSTVRYRKRMHGDYIYNGVDRMDNTGDYTPANAVPCCPTCNHAKYNLDYNDFLDWVNAVSSYGTPRAVRHGDKA